MTKGRRALLDILRRTKREYVACRCRVSISAVHMWCTGERTPNAGARTKLSVNYGIPLESWDEPLENSQGQPIPRG